MITLTTDVGFEYAGQMKGVILKINPNAKIIDITHSIEPQNILQGAFVLYTVVKYFPYAIHIGVVDPGVGTKRRGIILCCEKGILIGPDNGLLVPAAKTLKIKKVYEITNADFDSSYTFHGRDIFAPISAKISLGKEIEKFGKIIKDFKNLDFEIPKKIDGKIIGKVIYIDKFGNLITNIPKEIIEKEINIGEKIKIKIRENIYKLKFQKSYGYVEKGEILALVSSSNFLEVSCNMGNAMKKLKAKINDEMILWLE